MAKENQTLSNINQTRFTLFVEHVETLLHTSNQTKLETRKNPSYLDKNPLWMSNIILTKVFTLFSGIWHILQTYSVLWCSIPESKWLQRVVGGLEPNHRFTMVMNHLSFCTNVHGGGRVCSRSFFFLFAPYFPTLLWEIDNMFILKYSLAFFRFSFCMSTLCSSSAAAKVLEFRAECAACWTLFGPFHQVSQWNGSQYAKNACDWL